MKVIVAGSRGIRDARLVEDAIRKSGFRITELVSGGARGVDELGEQWAARNGVPARVFEVDWDRYGRGGGPLRNRQMAAYAEALVAVWDGRSPGTANMIAEARGRGLPVYVYRVGDTRAGSR